MSSAMDVSLLNRFGEPVVFLPDGPQDLVLEVKNHSNVQISIGTNSNEKPAAQPEFLLLMCPRVVKTVANGQPATLTSVTLIDGTTQQDMLAAFKPASTDPGNTGLLSLSLTVSPKVTLNPVARLRMVLSIYPDATAGARLARVELRSTISLLNSANPQTPFASTDLLQLNLVDISRKAYEANLEGQAITSSKSGPFEAAFLVSNCIVNDGATVNTLHVRVCPNLDVLPDSSGVAFGPDSSLCLTFDEASAERPWGIRVTEDVGPMKIADPALSLECSDAVWNFTGLSGAPKLPNSIFSKPLDLTIQVITRAQSGFTPLRIEYKNIPGYADGMLTLLAQLGPTFVVEDTTNLLSGSEPFSHATALALTKPLTFAGPGLRQVTGRLSAPAPSIGLVNDNSSLQISASHVNLEASSLTVNGNKPFSACIYQGSGPVISTGKSVNDFTAIVGGFSASPNSNSQITPSDLLPEAYISSQNPGGEWKIECTVGCSWTIWVLFIRNELVDTSGARFTVAVPDPVGGSGSTVIKS